MTNHNKQLGLKLLLAICILFASQINSYSLIVLNVGNLMFEKKVIESMPMETYITDGAGYFLRGYSDTLSVLQKIEVSNTSGLNYEELSPILKSAIGNMVNAVGIYRDLQTTSESAPYNPVMIERLKSFDYNGFKISRGLNASIFGEVAKYLSNGDPRGVFAKMSNNSEAILKTLQSINTMTENKTFPDLANLWRVNQLFSETMLFGQYAAEVFFEISNN